MITCLRQALVAGMGLEFRKRYRDLTPRLGVEKNGMALVGDWTRWCSRLLGWDKVLTCAYCGLDI